MACRSLIDAKLYCKSGRREGFEGCGRGSSVQDAEHRRSRYGSQKDAVAVVTGGIDQSFQTGPADDRKAVRRRRTQPGPDLGDRQVAKMHGQLLRFIQEGPDSRRSDAAIKSRVFVRRPDNQIAVSTRYDVGMLPPDHPAKGWTARGQRQNLTFARRNRNGRRQAANFRTSHTGSDHDLRSLKLLCSRSNARCTAAGGGHVENTDTRADLHTFRGTGPGNSFEKSPGRDVAFVGHQEPARKREGQVGLQPVDLFGCKQICRQPCGTLPLQIAPKPAERLLRGCNQEKAWIPVLRIDTALGMQLFGPCTIELRTGVEQVAERTVPFDFILGCEHTRCGPGCGISGVSTVEGENRSALNRQLAGNRQPDDSSADNDDIVHGEPRIAPPGQEGWREAPGWLFKNYLVGTTTPSARFW